ncbi:MAG: Ig-like domain-containing protein [Bacteroidales bacterium]|jgi:hypothetical protein|nr:Ig-like domain-containing protein [Bacteroidales bacterium]
MKKLLQFMLAIISMCVSATALQAQERTLYIMKHGAIEYQSPVAEIDSIIFYKPFFAVREVSMNKIAMQLTVGTTETLIASVAPENASDPTVLWSSSNTIVAQVSNGTVLGISEGKTVITAKAGEKIATCEVTVVKLVDWVEINGVKWATRNVDKPGIFAKTPESAGMFYQWNLRAGWSSADPLINTNGSTEWWNCRYDEVWENSNDPSPVGYRIPAKEELWALLDEDNVTNEWTTQNGVNGRKFTDKTTGASVFFPAAGFRAVEGVLNDVGNTGYYWSSQSWDYVVTNNINTVFENSMCARGLSLRPVLDVEYEVTEVRLQSTSLSLNAGEEYDLLEYVIPAVAKKQLTWTSSNPAIATVDARGHIIAKAEGTAIITAQTGEVSASCEITVLLSDPDWVLINGVKWATRNVDRQGTFAKTPESAGIFYEWGVRGVGWSTTDPMIATHGGTTWHSNGECWEKPLLWEKANDPSPAGYRVPTWEEMFSLIDESRVANEWTIQNGVGGRKFTDRTTGASIFLPASGHRDPSGNLQQAGVLGYYWIATRDYDLAHYMTFHNSTYLADETIGPCSMAMTIRSVKE